MASVGARGSKLLEAEDSAAVAVSRRQCQLVAARGSRLTCTPELAVLPRAGSGRTPSRLAVRRRCRRLPQQLLHRLPPRACGRARACTPRVHRTRRRV